MTDHYTEIHCSLARTLTIVGDRWTPLIVRDLWLGIDQFDQLVADLGLSRAVLTERLDRLVDAGVIHRERFQERPARWRYGLTESGTELLPILMALTQWGDRWRSAEPPLLFSHADCGAPLAVAATCAACGKLLQMEAVVVAPGPGGRAERGTRLLAARLTETQVTETQVTETRLTEAGQR